MTSAVSIYIQDGTRIESSRWLEDGSGYGGNATGDFFTGGSGIGCGLDSVHDGSSLLFLFVPHDDRIVDPLILEALRCG